MKAFWICLLSQKKQKQKLINGTQLNFPFAQKRKPLTKQNKTKKLLEWENIFVNDMTNKRLISKIHKQLMQLNIKKFKESYQKMG